MTDTAMTCSLSASAPAPSASAVEVVGTLGDSVVHVAHVQTNARPGRHRRAAKLWLAVAAALLAMSAIAFGVGVHNAANNERARAELLAAGDKPAHAFRPERLSLAYDWMAFGGLGAGVLFALLGVARLRTREPQSSFTIGRDADSDMATEHAPLARFPLVEARDTGAVVTFTGDMRGALTRGATSHPLDALAALGVATPSLRVPGAFEVAVPSDGAVRIELGQTAFTIRPAATPTRLMPAGLSAIERRVAAFLAGSAAVHLAIVGLLGAIPPDAATLTLDLAAEGNRLVRFESKAREDKRVEPDKGSGDATDQGEGSPDAQMAPGEEGAAGTTSSNANGKMAIKDRNRDNAISRADAITEARSAGFLGHLEGISEFASPEGFADYSSGDAAIDAYGRIDGEGFGPGGGNFGMGRRGFGPGGGGTVWTGNYRTIGWPGTGDDVGGSRLPGLRNRTHRAHAPVVEIKNARVEGELSKDIIRRYIKRQLPRIQHCYQRTLLVNSGVEGTVNTSFVISAQGAVLSSTASGIGDAELEGCIAGVVGSIQFPRPEGNGLVKVSYPFRLRTPGG